MYASFDIDNELQRLMPVAVDLADAVEEEFDRELFGKTNDFMAKFHRCAPLL
ncbi:hypothetical protein D3C87_1932460 [compost metagenome]